MYDAEKTKYLITLAKKDNKSALTDIICENMGLVKSIAIRFSGRGTEIDDLIQIGTIGMIKAVKGYDDRFGTAFSTYAVPLIIGEIRRFLRDDGLIKVSRDVKKNGYILLRTREQFLAEHTREPTISELSALTSIEPENILTALDASSPALSLQESISEDGDDRLTLENIVGTDNIGEITEQIALKEAIENLPADEKSIILLRYYKGMTQNETAQRLGLTQVKVSRKEKKIMEKLRKALDTA
jgi:RNA polymerase sigma factor, sigma-70 family